MECRDVRKHLHDYLDGLLDENDVRAVETHLTQCRSCTEELESLREYRERFANLSTIGAPDDFLQKVHQRVEQESRWHRLLRKLFRPAGIKVPVEFAAVATAVIAIIFVFHIIEPPRKEITRQTAPTPVEKGIIEGEVELHETVPQEPPVRFREKSEEPPLEMEEPFRQKAMEPQIEESAPQIATEADRSISPAVEEKRGEPAGIEPLEITLLVPKARGKKTESERVQPSAESGVELLSYDEAPMGAKKAEREILPIPNSTFSTIEELLHRSGVTILSMDYGRDADYPQSITLSLRADHMSSLFELLSTIGSVENPPEVTPSDENMVQIRILLRPAPIE